MELEDKIANAIDSTAKAAGVELKPCGACKERQETLNRISRRGFVGGTTAALALVKNKALFAAWQGLGLTPRVDYLTALPLLRTANLVQWHLYFQKSRHGSLADVMEMIVNHKGPEMDTTDPAFRWYTLFSPVTPKSNQVFNGWTMQQAVVSYALPRSNRQGSGYRLALVGPSLTFVSDELGVIYYAPTPETLPDLSTLPSASEFPNATALGDSPAAATFKAPTLWERVRSYFTPVYAQGGCALCTVATCTSLNCCFWCVGHCIDCGTGGCTEPGPCMCTFNPGCSLCPWWVLPCSGTSGIYLTECNKCARNWGTACCCLCYSYCT